MLSMKCAVTVFLLCLGASWAQEIEGDKAPPVEVATVAPFPSYDYGRGAKGEKAWADLDPRYASCADWTSPISIRNSYLDKTLEHLEFSYVDSPIDLEVRDKTLRWLFPPESKNFLMAKGRQYRLREIVVHTPSEHLIRGIRFPLELQFLHETVIPDGTDPVDAKKMYSLAAVSVLAVSGSSDHSGFDVFMRGMRTDVDVDMWKKGYNNTDGPLDHIFELPPASTTLLGGVDSVFSFGDKNERRQTGVSMNPADLLPQKRPYYTYKGQLTFPPCNPQVEWFVLNAQIQIKTNHAKRFYYETGPNARLANEFANIPRIARYDEPVDPSHKGLGAEVEELEVRGPRGDQGVPGDKGPVGLEGDIGPRGLRGRPGKDGVDGSPGAVGPRGEQGPQGRKGRRGGIGAVGAVGDDGDLGDAGPAGKDGADGLAIPGIQGPVGPRGDTIRGDDGPQGAPGDPGVTGPKGEPGRKGAKGFKGASVGGTQGQPGDDGPTGDEGAQGAPGVRGDAGKDGAVGPAGPRGIRGPRGPAGEVGPTNRDTFLTYSYLGQVEAQAYCMSVKHKLSEGWAFAVGRDPKTSGRTCDEICLGLREGQAGDLACAAAFSVDGPEEGARAFNAKGLSIKTFDGCKSHKTAEDGPNYCCCVNK